MIVIAPVVSLTGNLQVVGCQSRVEIGGISYRWAPPVPNVMLVAVPPPVAAIVRVSPCTSPVPSRLAAVPPVIAPLVTLDLVV